MNFTLQCNRVHYSVNQKDAPRGQAWLFISYRNQYNSPPPTPQLDARPRFAPPRPCAPPAGHDVEGGAGLEPIDLRRRHCVVQHERPGLAPLGRGDGGREGAIRGQDVPDLGKGNPVLWLDAFIVGGVGKGKRQHALLLQVCLVDARKRPCDDGDAAEVAAFQGGVLPAAPLPVVLVPNDHPLDAPAFEVAGHLGDGLKLLPLLLQRVPDRVCLAVLRVDGPDQQVVADVVEVPAVL